MSRKSVHRHILTVTAMLCYWNSHSTRRCSEKLLPLMNLFRSYWGLTLQTAFKVVMFFLSDRMFVFARISFSLDTFMKEAGVPCVLYSHKQQDIITSHNMFTKTNLKLDWLTWNESSTCDRRICVYTDNNHMIGMFCPNTDVGI